MATTSPSILRTEGKTSACMGLVSENICAAGWAARVGSRPWVVRSPWEQASQAPELCLPHVVPRPPPARAAAHLVRLVQQLLVHRARHVDRACGRRGRAGAGR